MGQDDVVHTYTDRFSAALDLAAELHAGQKRKSSDVPYVSHLLGVCALVWEDGGDEDEAIAALLHDAIEDQGDRITVDEIAARFGPAVADIVVTCTDAVGGSGVTKPAWIQRKADHLAHLSSASTSSLRVLAADKLHNVRSLLDDHRLDGPVVWSRFNGRLVGTVWYYEQVSALLSAQLPRDTSRLPVLLADAVAALVQLAEVDLASADDRAWAEPEGWPPAASLPASA